jgi:dUTP pyrophosphatase
MEVQLVHKNAVLPAKANICDVGYDLTIIEECKYPPKHECKNLKFYDTGIRIRPPPGFYLEIHARSSLMKTGHMLANATGIIDPDYRGNIIIALTKFDQSMPDLVIGDGLRVAQLVIRPHVSLPVNRVDNLNNTTRGQGGFGSTGQ